MVSKDTHDTDRDHANKIAHDTAKDHDHDHDKPAEAKPATDPNDPVALLTKAGAALTKSGSSLGDYLAVSIKQFTGVDILAVPADAPPSPGAVTPTGKPNPGITKAAPTTAESSAPRHPSP